MGVLLGTAVGDALGLPYEGMRPVAARRRAPAHPDRFRWFGRTGYVSDDTEQALLVADALIRHPGDPAAAARTFSRSLLWWFLRLPWGVGSATMKACIRMVFRRHPTGIRSAGNGAAMRAAVIGVFLPGDPDGRVAFGTALAQVTHTDPRGVAGALFVAETAAACAVAATGADRVALVRDAVSAMNAAAAGTGWADGWDGPGGLRKQVEAAALFGADPGIDPVAAGVALGSFGFVMHTVPLAVFFLVRAGDDPVGCVGEIIRSGGDTDTNAAVVGAWLGALHGPGAFPAELLSRLQRGPYGRGHLTRAGIALAQAAAFGPGRPPRWSKAAAAARNVCLFPVALSYALIRPFLR